MKVVSIVGARPQFIKAAPVSRLLRQKHTEVLVHTGQHYDANMSAVFFEELNLPPPEYHLGVGSGSHAVQTGTMLMRMEEVLIEEKPDWVLVYGDTNSTLAGALAAAKLHIKVAHVEAGLRSFNRIMPEEINRIVADHLSTLLFCPSQTAVENLAAEGITQGVFQVGDVMADALDLAKEVANRRSSVLETLQLSEKGYLLATIHRAENTDDPARLLNILTALRQLDEPVIFPIHPRTRKVIEENHWISLDRSSEDRNLRMIEPVGYLDMIQLEKSARMILTDSGGVQKEAYWLGVPCVTFRQETEWVETVETGWNVLAGCATYAIIRAVKSFRAPNAHPSLYGDGKAAKRMVEVLENSTSYESSVLIHESIPT